MMKSILAIPFYLFVFAMLSNGVAFAGSTNGDAEKKAAVYRLYESYQHEFPSAKSISAQQALDLQRQGRVVFVDVRKPAEMEISMLPSAVPAKDYSLSQDRFKGKIVVAYCTIGYRSGMFAEKMAEQGATVLNLEGGILAWLWAGGKLHDAGGRTVKRVHVYAEKWDLAPVGYATSQFGFWQRLF